MLKYSEVLNKIIFSIEEGKKCGKIVDAVIDIKKFIIKGFLIDNNTFLPFSEIKTFGEENIVFNSEKNLAKIKDLKNNEKKGEEVKGKLVITKKGKISGKIENFYFNNEGKITYYEVVEKILSNKKLLSQDGVVLIGEDVMIITDVADEIANSMKVKGGVEDILKLIKKKTKESSKEIAEKVKDYKEKGKKQINEIKKEAKDKTKNIKEKVTPEIKKATSKIKEVVKKVKKKNNNE